MVGLSDTSLAELAAGGWTGEGLQDPQEREAFSRAQGWLAEWQELRDRLAPSELIERIIRSTGYLAAIVPLFQGPQKVANVRKLVDMAREYEENGAYNFRGFVRYLTELVDDRAREPEYPVWAEKADVVRIMTVHQAKGLQFPIVIVPQLSRESSARVPALRFHREHGVVAKVRADAYHPWLRPHAFSVVDDEMRSRELEESKRLFYVAVTRAADHVILSGPANCREGTWGYWLQRFNRLPVVEHVPPAPVLETDRTGAVALPEVGEVVARVRGFSPRPSELLSISARDLAEYMTCARRHYYASILNLEEAPPRPRVPAVGALPAAERGSLIHRVLEEVPFDASAETVDRLLARLSGGAAPEELREEVLAFLAGPTGRELKKARLIGREVPLHLTVRDSDPWTLLISGVADLVYQDEHGGWHLIDYKESFVGRGKLPLYQTQLALYAVALMRAWSLESVEVGLRFLRDRQHSVRDTIITQQDADALLSRIARLARHLVHSTRTLAEEAWPKVEPVKRCHDMACGFRWRCGRLPVETTQLELELE
ncbi:MAG: PD-(D/E)XK nuclease family protein [Candidatus Xenobia bacterium]